MLHVSDTEHVPAYMTDTHKQKNDWFCGEMSVAVCCLTLMTDGTQTDGAEVQ